MPWKPKKPCKHPGCKNLSDQTYCEVHRKEVKAEQNRLYDERNRDPEMKAFYSSAGWRKVRALKARQTPVCEECLRQGRVVQAEIVDHILPAREYPRHRLRLDNLQSLCRACHNRKHGGTVTP
jgi:5-methylcytosine-specific restriction protein A